MRKKKTSIHDIAKHLKVSATTVSFIINGKAEEKGIRQSVAEKVNKYIQKVGYKPSLVAQSLRTGKTNVLCMLVESISDPFFAQIAQFIEIKAYDLGYKIFFASTENKTDKAKELIRVFRERQVDGFIIAPPPGLEEEIQGLLSDKIPLIVFDRYFPNVTSHNIVVDNYNGALQAVRHLAGNGFSNIGFITIQSDQTQMNDRLKGYADGVKEIGKKKVVCKIPYNIAPEKIVEKIKSCLIKHSSLDAVLFATNYIALNGVEAISEIGLKIPNEIAVISFDDNNHFKLIKPSLSAIAQPLQSIAETIVGELMKRLSGKVEENQLIVLPTTLIQRSSTLPVKARNKR